MTIADQSPESSDRKPKIAVTGAGGLVGSYLVKYLLEKNYPTVAVVRTPGKPAYLLDVVSQHAPNAELEIADVNDAPALGKAFTGVDIVVHAAGSVDPFGSRDDIFRTNVEGTKTVLRAARNSAVKQFVHVSSLSTITGQGDQYDVDESAPVKYCGENYADSKVAAEEALAAEGKSGGINITIVRPGFIYGPHEKGWMPRLIESIRTGKAALIDGGTKDTNVIYVENLCRAIEGSFLKPIAYGQCYNLTDGEKVSKKQLFDAISDGLNLPKVKKVVPSAVAKPFCTLISSIAPILPVATQRKLARYSRAAYRLVGVNQGFSVKKAESQLGYTDRVPFSEGMLATLTTFRNEGKGSSGTAGSANQSSFAGSGSTRH